MNIYQIKITLRHIHPPVWRRIQVMADTKLGKLHHILQDVMGWTNSHMHAFVIGDNTYGEPDLDPTGDLEMENESNVRIDKVAKAGDTLIYEYDFGDGWEHELKIEKILETEPGAHYPVCLAGERACPPEDCGGPPGYAYLLEALNDPQHEEREEMREWVGDNFNPERFEVDEVNRQLKGVR